MRRSENKCLKPSLLTKLKTFGRCASQPSFFTRLIAKIFEKNLPLRRMYADREDDTYLAFGTMAYHMDAETREVKFKGGFKALFASIGIPYYTAERIMRDLRPYVTVKQQKKKLPDGSWVSWPARIFINLSLFRAVKLDQVYSKLVAFKKNLVATATDKTKATEAYYKKAVKATSKVVDKMTSMLVRNTLKSKKPP